MSNPHCQQPSPENEFRISEKVLSTAAHHSQNSIIITTSDLDAPGPTIVYVNPAFTKMTGYLPEEVLGKSPRILQGPKTDRAVIDRLRATIAKGEVFMGQTINYKKDGSEYCQEWHISPIRDESNVITHYLAVQYDISERRKQLALVESLSEKIKEQSQFQIAIDAAPNGMLLVDQTGNIKFANKVTVQLLGYSREELLGMCVDDLMSRQYKQSHSVYRQQFYQNPQTRYMGVGRDLYALRKDGCEVPVEIGLNPIEIDGKVCVMASLVDISERKKIEVERLNLLNELERRVLERTRELTLKNEELQRANIQAMAAMQAKSNFLANMSHEIRTPMNSIIGFADIMAQTSLDDSQAEYIKSIKSSGDLLITIINDILDLSKLDARMIKFETIDFDLEYLISDVFKIVSSRLFSKDIHMYIDFDLNLTSCVVGDPTRLRQILINLLGNAIKFTEKGEIGVVVIKDESLSTGSESVVRFIVHDTGIGIPRDKLAQIFLPFTQADDSTTRKFGGTGLGLTISKNLVEQMGGRLWVESIEGTGSDFIFELKFKNGRPLSDQAINPLNLNTLKGKRVLIVDDNKLACEITQKYCNDIGLKVVSLVNNPQAVLEILKKLSEAGEQPDMILTDIMMLQMDGFTLAQLIRKNEQYNKIVLIAVSSDFRIGVADKLKEKGFNGFLPKPVIRDELVKVVAAVLGDRRKEGPIVNRHMAEELSVKGVRVLLVEDVKANRDLMKAYFNMLGVIADYAENGQEAIEKIRTNTYDICFMDLQMPVMGGVEAAKIIREQINKTIPIIALTANVMEEDRRKCIEVGMNDFLTKPINVSALKEKIKEYFLR